MLQHEDATPIVIIYPNGYMHLLMRRRAPVEGGLAKFLLTLVTDAGMSMSFERNEWS
jgi:hypothetical protein